MKKTVLFLSVLILVFASGLVLAQNNQLQNQNQVQTQNQAEDSQLQVETQQQEALQDNKPNLRNQTAKENMSAVAEKVEELLSTQTAKGGIGKEISQFAKEQKQAQVEIKRGLEKLETRPQFVKKLFGSDHQAIKNLNQQIEQNRLRIQNLEQLASQTQNQAEENEIRQVVQVLNEQNTILQNQVKTEEKVKSLFGWLVRLFNR